MTFCSYAFNPQDQPSEDNVRRAMWGLVAAYLCYSAIQGPSSLLLRPHPAVWRLVHGIMICYLLFLIFLLFQTLNGARMFMKELYPELGVELPERAYGDSCNLWLPGGRFNWQALHDTVFDEFVLAHTLGWWGKAVILRDETLLWTLSIAFELMEKTFQHYLPNFNECWWDSWVLDVLICNWLGIITGMWTVRYFKSKQYNWRGISKTPTLRGKIKRGLLQFTPASFDDLQWASFSSPKRLAQSLFPVVIFLLLEVNHFFLKFLLWVPPLNAMNTYRLLILALAGIPGIKEYYEFIDGDSGDIFTKLGPYAWTTIAIALVETLIVIKFSRGVFAQPWPTAVVWSWTIALTVLITVYCTWAVRFYRIKKKKKGTKRS